MANTTISPNMSLPIPVPGVDPGPDWTTNLNASLTIIDGHNHSTGSGVPIPPSGLNINTDLPMNGNNLTLTRTVRFASQSAALVLGTDVGCIYEVGNDLWFNNGGGTAVQITSGSSVNAGPGSIGGLPSGTASVTFATGTYTFLSAASTPATLKVGPLIVGAQVASPNTVTIAPSSSLPASYNLTLPQAVPVSSSEFLIFNPAGQMGSVGDTGTGLVVLQTAPTINNPNLGGVIATGLAASSAVFTDSSSNLVVQTVTSGTYTATVTATVGSAATSVAFSYLRIFNRVFVDGQISGTSASSGAFFVTTSLPFAPTSNFAAATDSIGIVGSTFGGLTESIVQANVGAKTVSARAKDSSSSTISMTINIHFSYSCA